MTTSLYVNDYVLGEFDNVEIQNFRLILKDATINNYKLLSWLQGDPNNLHNLDLDIRNTYGINNVSVSGGKIKQFVTDDRTVRKIVIDCTDIHIKRHQSI